MPQAYDFSFSRPTPAQLVSAGASGVCVYLLGPGKAISKPELDAYLAAGLSACFIVEYTTTDVASGYGGGVANAGAGLSALSALGVAGPVPIYMTCDEDLPDPTVAEPYYQGAASVLTPARVGDYGEGALMLDLAQKGLSSFHWLSESTGFPGYQEALSSGLVALEQKVAASPVPGTDLNEILKTDFGQFPRPIPQPEGINMADVSVVVINGEAQLYYPANGSRDVIQGQVQPGGGWKVSDLTTGESLKSFPPVAAG